jgi:hypothetical protein
VSRRTVVWLLVLPLAIGGSQAAHSLAYRLATASDHERSHELATSGHAYLDYAPLALAVCAALVALALARELAGVLGGHGRSSRPSALTFAALAPAIFVAQEHVERLAHGGAIPASLLLAPTFLVGLALQLPFALLAYALARLLLRAASAVARLLASPRTVVLRVRSRWQGGEVRTSRGAAHGLALGARGPPPALAV